MYSTFSILKNIIFMMNWKNFADKMRHFTLSTVLITGHQFDLLNLTTQLRGQHNGDFVGVYSVTMEINALMWQDVPLCQHMNNF
jgi:hypothetical protein